VGIVTIAVEEQRVRNLFERVEEVEDVANSLPEADGRRRRLLNVSNATLAEEATIRPVIAARLLGLSEKTIRTWADQGVLVVSQRAPRLLLDVMSVHEVSHLIRELRAKGRDRDLLDEVWHRLNDGTLTDREDFNESLNQMRRGQGRTLRPLPDPDGR
jgi:DNA-binding transcriptional MerR regulator